MLVIKLLILAVLLVPVLFVIGTVASSADIIGPLPAGVCQEGLHNIARAGEGLKAATEELAAREIRILVEIVQGLGGGHQDIYEEAKRAYLSRKLAETSI